MKKKNVTTKPKPKPKPDLRFGIGRRRSRGIMEAVVGGAVEVENGFDGGMTERRRRRRGKRRESASAALRFAAERREVEKHVSVVEGREWLGEAQHVRNGRHGVQRHHREREREKMRVCVENRMRMKIKGRRGRGQEVAESHRKCLSHTHATNSSHFTLSRLRLWTLWVSTLCAQLHAYSLVRVGPPLLRFQDSPSCWRVIITTYAT